MRSLAAVVVGVVLLAGTAAVALFVAAAGSSTTVQLVWDRAGLDVRSSALGLFLVGAVVVLVAEVGVRLLLGVRGGARPRPGPRRRSSR